jgi:2-polyprenyl-3-methyl-5-hydroxy-6-metoxy-1,4-benzoquinol methylase
VAEELHDTSPIQYNEQYRELVERLNRDWQFGGAAPASGSVKHRALYRVRRFLARLLGTQEHFNASVAQFVNTLNEAAGPALGALDDVERHREALLARERRMDIELAQIRAEQQELRAAVGVMRQTNHDLARVVERLRGGPTGLPGSGATAAGGAAAARATTAAVSVTTPAAPLVALGAKYVGFEDQFRGSPDAIRARLVAYADLFAGASDVLDIGCGRGEFLALLAERGVTGRGIDVNESMVEVCRQQGLSASREDALTYVQSQAPGSLGGLLAAQVVEHLDPAYLTDLLDAAWRALRPGSVVVLETINPACWFAFFESYIRDITHVRPLHPDTLKHLLLASGFERVEIRFRSPYPDHDKLQTLAGASVDATADVFNANVEKLNRLLFTHLDYAAVARRA